ncbi:MAG TPA: lysophospholipid acyltransferase family protein, partial [Acidimicrobiales bacterium]|nr:lysophospholipid acyltransferase family protein [Acidimicrobiales bacterium]
MAGVPPSLARRLPRLPFPFSSPTVPDGVETLPSRPRSGPDYDTAWSRRMPARVARVALVEGLARPAVAALARPERHGLDRLAQLADAGGSVIFAANHHSHLDTPLLVTSIPEPWRHELFVVAAADYFFRTPATSALSALALGAIPMERTKVGRRSADQAAALLDDGWSMLIFPEGGRSPDGWGQPFRGGAAYLALRCGVPVVPVHIEGTGRILRKGRKLPSPASTRLTFGTPLQPTPDEDSRRFAARLERTVAALADEATTDWWSARRRAHAGAVGPASAGVVPACARRRACHQSVVASSASSATACSMRTARRRES